MLSAKLGLHDVRDVGAFTAAVIHRSNANLSREDMEDAHAYLITTTLELSQRYEQRGESFSYWVRPTLQRRLIDWQRKRFGRTRWQWSDSAYERRLIEQVSFDVDEASRDRLEQALGARDGDRTADRDADLGWLRAERDRCRARDNQLLGISPDTRAP